MQGNGLGGSNGSVDDHCIGIDVANLEGQGEMGNLSMEKGREGESSVSKLPQPQIGAHDGTQTVVAVVISNGVLENQFGVTPEPKESLVSNGVSCNFDSVMVGGSVISNGESRKCDVVAVNFESKGSLVSSGEACNDSVPKKIVGEGLSSVGELAENVAQAVLAVVISNRFVDNQLAGTPDPRETVSSKASCNHDSVAVVVEPEENPVKSAGTKIDRVVGAMSSAKMSSLSRSESFDDQCRLLVCFDQESSHAASEPPKSNIHPRLKTSPKILSKGFRKCSRHDRDSRVCQQSAEEDLIDLGCQCRGGLSKAHRSCIDTWFRTRGSNKCEICQQEASNVSPPDPQPSRNYWVWRFDPTFAGSGIAHERERSCCSPLWVAFSILIGGLLLDVLISISLGVSALPVNIIIGVLVLLGIGTALRLAFECCHELSLRRAVQRADSNITLGPLGYHPAV